MSCDKALSGRHRTCAHTAEQWEKIWAAQPFHRRCARDLKILTYRAWNRSLGPIADLWERFQHRVRLFWYGYDPQNWWKHHLVVSRIAVKHLAQMHDRGHGIKLGGTDINVQGVSFDGEGRDEWKAMLADMIFFHQVASGQLEPRTKVISDSLKKILGEDAPTSGTIMHIPEFNDLDVTEQRRYRRGKFYYFKYFEHLWD